MGTARVVLVTGFEPFGGDRTNASELAVRPLEGRIVAGARITTAILPCRFGAAIDALDAEMARAQPCLVIACGEAGGRHAVSLERVAINVDDARIPDNAGAQPIDVPVVADGPVAHFSTLPIKAIVRAIGERGIPAEISQSAGTFVCNHVFYALMHALASRPEVRGGFVHVPRSPAQHNPPRMPTVDTPRVTEAIEIAIATALTTKDDARIGGGATH
jgi:pyroglutamyl-peptidase